MVSVVENALMKGLFDVTPQARARAIQRAELGNEAAQQAIDINQANVARQDVVAGTNRIKAMNDLLKTKSQQEQNLLKQQSRIISGLKAGDQLPVGQFGFDQEDATNFATDPEKMINAANLALRAFGEDQEEVSFEATKTFIDPKTGNQFLGRVNKRTGAIVPVTGGAPVPKQGETVSLTDANGNTVTFRKGGEAFSEGQNVPLDKSVAKKTQTDLIGLEDQLANILNIEQVFNPDFLRFLPQMQDNIGNFLDQLGVDRPEEAANFTRERVKFENEVNQFFNQYRKVITGAAASEKEMEDLRKSILNTNQGPVRFRGSLENMKERLKRGIRVRRSLLRDGINLDDTGFKDEFERRMYLFGFDDDPKLRADEIKKNNPNLTVQEVIDKLDEEGYKLD